MVSFLLANRCDTSEDLRKEKLFCDVDLSKYFITHNCSILCKSLSSFLQNISLNLAVSRGKLRHWILEPLLTKPYDPEHVNLSVFCYISSGLNNWVFPKCFHWIRWIQWQKILYFKKIIQSCHLLCKRPICYHSTNKTHVAERIFKLSPIHASVIYQIDWIHWISDPFRKNSNELLDTIRLNSKETTWDITE